ncbi:hypothetical protein DFN06_002208 [Clostridium beijerinckii]|jgi:hypothetical protein|nr:hypothetical protein [Clostridium beijerinckii]NOV72670.1 hypothetical protein [Clostridium beijerinckii]NOW34631.1 hypothetical protein [Clostridium beijerinckii]NOW84376.1 hypothetical protein [Clostridium beijerinckii]NRZ26492.1 hypothetical protein [Clostridium beijerinckii]
MIKVLDPQNDVVFQKLFGMKAHKINKFQLF